MLFFIVPENKKKKSSSKQHNHKINRNKWKNKMKRLSRCKNLALEKVSDLNCFMSCSGIIIFECVCLCVCLFVVCAIQIGIIVGNNNRNMHKENWKSSDQEKTISENQAHVLILCSALLYSTRLACWVNNKLCMFEKNCGVFVLRIKVWNAHTWQLVILACWPSTPPPPPPSSPSSASTSSSRCCCCSKANCDELPTRWMDLNFMSGF